MPYFRVHDSILNSVKMRGLSGEALGLWLRLGVRCVQLRNHGVVRALDLKYAAWDCVDGDEEADELAVRCSKELVKAGLWHTHAGVRSCAMCSLITKREGIKLSPRHGQYLTGDFYFHDFVHWQYEHADSYHRSNIPKKLRAAVLARDGYVCGICGQPVGRNQVQIDHIVPVVEGGSHALENLQVTHGRCNRAKGGQRR